MSAPQKQLIRIHQAVFADLDTLLPLFDQYRQFYGASSDTAAGREFLRQRMNYGQSVIFLAQLEDQAAGFTQLYPSFSSVSMARTFVLNDLFVAPQARRQGVAQALMTAAVDYARAQDAAWMRLSTQVSNSQAQALYEHCGWKRDEQFQWYQLGLR